MASKPSEPNAPTWVKVLVAIHLLMIVIWATPNPAPAVTQGVREPTFADQILIWNVNTLKSAPPVRAYAFTTATWQYWDMFAPDPSNTDLYGDAEVVFRDGSVRPYQYPRIKLLPIPQKYPMERYRKFYERAHAENATYMWAVFARRIAFLNNDAANPPVRVRLFRHWQPVAPPGGIQQETYNKYMYFEYVVAPSDLARAEAGRLW
ncbi:MAG: hypothetical protein ACOYON_05250 [Fimbriimonas sp.]